LVSDYDCSAGFVVLAVCRMAHDAAPECGHSQDVTHRVRRRSSAWALAGLAVLAAGVIAHASAQRGTPVGGISGVIVDADTGVPLRGVRVVLTVSASGSPVRTGVSDAAGRYAVTPLFAGTYTVTASIPAYVEATFGRHHQIDAGGSIDIAPGQVLTRVDFQLSREAIVAGRIVGTDGKGLAGLVVNVSRPHVQNGRRRLVSFAEGRTDSTGDYRVGGLLPGDYYVSVSLFEGTDSRVAKYAPTFFPGSADVAGAKRVRLGAGKVVGLPPVTPLPVPWTTLSGRLRSFDGKQLMRGALIIQPGDPDSLSFSPDAVSEMFPDGRFTFNFVVPGRYIVRAVGSSGNNDPDLFASWPVTVAGRSIPEEAMVLKPGSDVAGRTQFDAHGTRPPGDLRLIRVHAPLLDATGFGIESETQLQRDGSFHLASVDAGRMLFRVDGLPAPWSVARITQGGYDITDRPLDIVQGQRLRDIQIVFTDVVTGLTGVVRNRAGVPLVNYMVVVFPVDRALWRPLSRYIGATRTDWEGRYRLVSLPPGAYRVAAVADFEEEEIYDRDALDQISLRSVPAVLAIGTLPVKDLVVIVGQRSDGG
jgi:hypothetical protein